MRRSNFARTEDYFSQRARRSDRAETLRILQKAGKGNPPLEGDELPTNARSNARRKVQRAKLPRKPRKAAG